MSLPDTRTSKRRAAAQEQPASGRTVRSEKPNAIVIHSHAFIDPERRHRWTAEAAYFYAQQRGFEPGYELDDWLAAEAQIEAALALGTLPLSQ